MNAPAHIPFSGRADNGLGIAMWQADGTGPEPAATGHRFSTPLEPITAHYYIASREYDGIDAHARGGLEAVAPFRGFTRFAAALAHARLEPPQLILKLPLITPGDDREGHEWTYRDGVETRFLYPHGPVRLELAGELLMALPVPLIVLTEDYRDALTFDDVRLALVSEPFVPQPSYAGTRASVALAGEALIADLAGVPLRLVAESIVLLPETFASHGRTDGRFGEIPAARIEVVAG